MSLRALFPTLFACWLLLVCTGISIAQVAGEVDPKGQATEAFAKGRTLEEQGKTGEAYEQYRLAYELDTGHYRAVYRAARLLREMGKRQNAHAALRRAIAIAPGFYPAYNHLGLLLVEQGNLEGAVDAYRGGTEAAPDLGQAWRNLGRALAEAGRLDEAVGAYERALALEPNHAGTRAALATLYDVLGNTEAAAELRDGDEPLEALDLTPAKDAGEQEMADTGTAASEPVSRAYPYPPLGVENPIHLRTRGIEYVRAGHYQAGVKALVASLRYGGPDPEAYAELGFARIQLGDYPGAAWAYGQAAEIAGPEAPGHRLNQALALRDAGDPAGAKTALRRALDQEPAFAHAHYLLGVLELEEHDLPAAVRRFRSAVQADPAHTGAHYALATTLDNQGRTDDAIRTLRLTLRLHPGDPDALAILGHLLERKQLYGEALDAYEALLVVTTGDSDRSEQHNLASTKVQELAYAATQLAPSLAGFGDNQPPWMRDGTVSEPPTGPPFTQPSP